MAKKVILDFTNVKEGGGNFRKTHYPAGDYKGKVLSVQDAKNKKDNSPMWLFTIAVKAGKYPYYCTFTEKTLWKIRNLFVAAGITVPKKRMNVDPSKVVGKVIGVTLDDDEYDGKLQSVIASVFPASELENSDDDDDVDEDDEDSEEADDDEDDGETEDSADDEDDDSDDDEDEEPEPPKKKKKKKTQDDDDLEELDIEDV